MQLETVILRKSERERKIPYDTTYMWNLKYNTNEHIYKRKTDTEEKTCDCQGWGGMEWEFGISRCKLLYIGWINNKALLYSTGNSIQYPVINHNGKEY